jgi:hypothetical protein
VLARPDGPCLQRSLKVPPIGRSTQLRACALFQKLPSAPTCQPWPRSCRGVTVSRNCPQQGVTFCRGSHSAGGTCQPQLPTACIAGGHLQPRLPPVRPLRTVNSPATRPQDTNLPVAVCLLLSLCRDKPGCALPPVQVDTPYERSEEFDCEGRDCLASANVAAGTESLGSSRQSKCARAIAQFNCCRLLGNVTVWWHQALQGGGCGCVRVGVWPPHGVGVLTESFSFINRRVSTSVC